MKFESFYFYTNQRALKNYLVNYKIEPSVYRNELNRTLSDLGQNFLLFWKSEIGVETILKNCKTDGGDIPVVLKVLLPAETVVEAYFSDETIKSAKISECSTVHAVKFACPVSFFNVTDIFYVDKQIQFLQGDTTLIIPKQLIRNEPFTAFSALDDNIVDGVITSDYDKITNLDFRKFRYSDKYAAIIVGPMPHSVKGKGDYSSGLEMLKNEPGYPDVFECVTSEKLKVTRTSINKALQEVNYKLMSR